MPVTHHELEKAILKSQHCQRNWDLSRAMPAEDIETLKTAVSQCPSKQNIAFYNAYFISNRPTIERVHEMSDGFTINYQTGESTTNSQVLANLLVVFEEADISDALVDPYRNRETLALVTGKQTDEAAQILNRDMNMAVGIAAGYINLTATLLGYSTGCCACFDTEGVKTLLGLKRTPVLLMGIGFQNEALGRRVHHANHDFVFPTKPKQPIKIVEIG